MVYVVRVACHIYLDIYLDIHLDIHLDIYLNIHLNVHLHLTLPPPHLDATPLHYLRFTASLLSPSKQSESIRFSCPPHLP